MCAMLSWTQISSAETSKDPAWGPRSIDFGTGTAAAALITAGSLLFGGFSFFEPWVILSVLAMFAAGFVRGLSHGTTFQKTSAVCATPLLLLLVTVRPLVIAIPVGIAAITFPALAGIWARRFAATRKSHT